MPQQSFKKQEERSPHHNSICIQVRCAKICEKEQKKGVPKKCLFLQHCAFSFTSTGAAFSLSAGIEIKSSF